MNCPENVGVGISRSAGGTEGRERGSVSSGGPGNDDGNGT
jgi:hypothetical protein